MTICIISMARPSRININKWEKKRLALLKPPYDEWVERVIFYYREGYVNDELLAVLTEMTLWKAEADRKRHYDRAKRFLDIGIAAVLILLLSPILTICAVLIKMESKGPIFFRQLRSGLHGQPFWILKFRTMPVNPPQNLRYLKPMEKPSQRGMTTRIGEFLRAHKLDELPQLWNVLVGDMSLVGPRPLSMNDTSVAKARYYSRFSVRPGMTGMWQALIANNSDGERKLIFDTIYIKKRSFSLDFYLIFRTIFVVFRGENTFVKRKKINASKKND